MCCLLVLLPGQLSSCHANETGQPAVLSWCTWAKSIPGLGYFLLSSQVSWSSSPSQLDGSFSSSVGCQPNWPSETKETALNVSTPLGATHSSTLLHCGSRQGHSGAHAPSSSPCLLLLFTSLHCGSGPFPQLVRQPRCKELLSNISKQGQ